jgi:glycosyltransferase involved in cell wall biosynthesis
MDVSIIIPYNIDRGYLKRAVTSAQKQVFKGNFEIITSHSKASLSVNVNEGIRRAAGKYIKFLSEDDELPPYSIQQLFNFCEKNNLDWCVSVAQNINVKTGKTYLVKSKLTNFEELCRANTIHGGTTIYKRIMLAQVNGYDETLPTAEEYDLHLRLMKSGFTVGFLDTVTYIYYIHEQAKSRKYRAQENLFNEKQKIMRFIKDRYR